MVHTKAFFIAFISLVLTTILVADPALLRSVAGRRAQLAV